MAVSCLIIYENVALVLTEEDLVSAVSFWHEGVTVPSILWET